MNHLLPLLHSKYQPQLEADRYIKALNLRSDIDFFILIEPGLGYIACSLQKSHPNSKLVILHADSMYNSENVISPETPAWHPGCASSVQDFLEMHIPDTASVHIIEWKPSYAVYGESCLALIRHCAQFIKRAAASRRTGEAFGKKWVLNFFRNIMSINHVALFREMDIPVLVTGSGPSLEASLPHILANRDNIFILGSSSSLAALASFGIYPDMTISTDGGSWALTHLYVFFRGAKMPDILALSMSAAVPSQCSAFPVLPICDGSLWQSICLHAAGIPSVLLSQRGTVTASAVELALILSKGAICLAGMDMALSDIQTHARPNGFDYLFSNRASRFNPVYSQMFMRAGDIQGGGSHAVYASWFKNRLSSWPKRIYSLGSNHNSLTDNLPGLCSFDHSVTANAGHFTTVSLNGNAHERCKHAMQSLISALNNDQYKTELRNELAPLLFPAKKSVSAGEIAETLKTMTRKYFRG